MSLNKKINHVKRRRISPRQDSLVQDLRAGITSGRWKPGEQLPTVQQLVDQYELSSVTVQRAVQQLHRDGFIRTAHRQGLFVADKLPNRSRFAIVFPHRPTSTGYWSRYWFALTHAAAELEKAAGVEFPIFYDIEHAAHQTADFEELVQTVVADRVAGLIFAQSPHNLRGTPVLDRPGLPRVAFMSGTPMPGVTPVTIASDLISRAMDLLQARGRRRIALLTTSTGPRIESSAFVREFRAELIARGLSIQPYWIQSAPPIAAEWAHHAVHAMLHKGQTSRPDALIIADDNLSLNAQHGVRAAGLVSPRDLDVISHANFPCEPESIMPMQLLGLDTRELLITCVKAIMQIRSGSLRNPPAPLASKMPSELPPMNSLAQILRAETQPA